MIPKQMIFSPEPAHVKKPTPVIMRPCQIYTSNKQTNNTHFETFTLLYFKHCRQWYGRPTKSQRHRGLEMVPGIGKAHLYCIHTAQWPTQDFKSWMVSGVPGRHATASLFGSEFSTRLGWYGQVTINLSFGFPSNRKERVGGKVWSNFCLHAAFCAPGRHMAAFHFARTHCIPVTIHFIYSFLFDSLKQHSCCLLRNKLKITNLQWYQNWLMKICFLPSSIY